MLTPKKALFVVAYIPTQNATQAAITAGYSEKTAKQQGSRLLTDVDVKAALEAAHATALQVVEEAQQSAVANAQWIIERSVQVVEIGMATVPVRGRDGKVIETHYNDEDGNEVAEPAYYEAANLTAANGALKLLAAMHPATFSPDTGAGEQGARHLHLHGLNESQLRALADGFSA